MSRKVTSREVAIFYASTLGELQKIATVIGVPVRGFDNREQEIVGALSIRPAPLPPAIVQICRTGVRGRWALRFSWLGEEPVDGFRKFQEIAAEQVRTNKQWSIVK